MNKNRLKFLPMLAAIFMLLSSSMAAVAATETASDVLNKAIATLKSAKGIDARFVVAAGAGSGSAGNIIISGNRFRLNTSEVSVWFDGRTQWAYSPAMNEVNISEPTLEELGQINPFAVVDGLKKGYRARLLTAPAGKKRIELTPTSKQAPYSKVILTLNATTYMPSGVVITSADGAQISVDITSLKTTDARSPSEFTFRKADYPGVEVVDLR